MKKSKKLLSVLLAILMILSSVSVMASAARTNYKTSDDLANLDAYSPYGQVTRLSTEERTSILFDYLDEVLANANINMGEVMNIGLIEANKFKVTVDLRSVNALCGTVDSLVHSVRHSTYWGVAKGLIGVLGNLKVSTWTEGMTREGTDQLVIIQNLLALLNENADLINTVLKDGLNVGIVGNFVDLSSVQDVIQDLPGLIKDMVIPLFYRWDDSIDLMTTYNNAIKGDGKFEAILSGFVQRLFTNNMSIASYAVDANGKCISEMTLPTEDGKRTKFVLNGDTIVRYSYDLEKKAYCSAEDAVVYTKTARADAENEFVFVDADGNELQWYMENSPALHCFLNEDGTTKFTIDITTDSAMGLLFKFIPYVVEDLAVVPVNGSLKKEMAWLFGAQWGDPMTEEQVAAAAKAGPAAAEFFNKPEGVYAFGYSDYAVIDGDHYWRYENSFYKADLSNINPFFEIINWDFHFNGDFMNKYLPNADGTAKEGGYARLLQNLNNFLVEIANEVLVPELVAKMNLVTGDNTQLIENLKRGARVVIDTSAASIFGADYKDHYPYYDMMMNSTDNQEVLCGIAMSAIQALMPQFIVPAPEKMQGQKVGVVLAMLVRELATQLVPNHNFDALIYDGAYENKTPLAGKDNSYWLDVILTMGTDIGVFYLKNLADMGEDQPAWAAMAYVDGPKTYTVADLNLGADVNLWEQRVDYIIDWALGNEEYSWKVGKLVNYGSETVDLATVQNPWIKLGNILKNHLPITDLLNVSTDADNWLETTLRDNFVMALLNLDVETVIGGAEPGILSIPTNSILRQPNLLSNIVVVVRNLLNGLVSKVGGNFTLIPESITTLDAVLNQSNIATVATTLIQHLPAAQNNGLLDLAMPFVNMFAGWKISAQTFAKPDITFVNSAGTEYVYKNDSATQKISIYNPSSGMLEKHGNAYDEPYNIVIDEIVTTTGSVAYTAGTVIAPGGKAEFTFNATDDNARLRVEVKYHYTFKDGARLGTQQIAYAYNYVTSASSNMPSSWSDKQTVVGVTESTAHTSTINTYIEDIKNLESAINSLYVQVDGGSSGGSAGSKTKYTGFNSTYIKYSGQAYTGVANNGVTVVNPAVYTGADTSALKSGDTIAAGTFSAETKWGLTPKTYTVNFGSIYYADLARLKTLFASAESQDFQRIYFDATADAEWNAFLDAMGQAAYYAKVPKNTSTFASIFSQANMDKAYNDLDAAIKNLTKKASSAATSDVLVDALQKTDPSWLDETSTVPGVNYQDYRLYEYFQYDNQRKATFNRINAYETAAKEGKSLTYTALDNADLAQKTKYYRQFLVANTTNYQFLEKEIAYANAQNYIETEYTAESWANYANALAKANDIMSKHNAGTETLQSQVFDAKYDLMLRQNQLEKATATAQPELLLSEYGAGMGAVIDRNRCVDSGEFAGCIYGVDTLAGEDLAGYLTTPAGSIRINSICAGGEISTGATIELLDNDGNVIETYVFVYFGDVTMDGQVDTMDASLLEEYYGFISDIETEWALMAGDVTMDGEVDTMDATALEEYYGFISDLPSQADIAASYAG